MSAPARHDDAPGDLLARIEVTGPGWAAELPSPPPGVVCTVTLGHPDLLGDTDLTAGRYRVVGVASAARPVGTSVDVYLPAPLVQRWPDFVADVVRASSRVFDCRMGPVQLVLAPQLALHARAAS